MVASSDDSKMVRSVTDTSERDGPVDPVIERLKAVLKRFNITLAQANDLVCLADYEMVVIADDSGSMNNSATASHKRHKDDTKSTRWDELIVTVKEMVEIASCFDESGIDVYFLNRPPALEVKHAEDEAFAKAFEKKPSGSTPLAECLQKVAETHQGDERKVICFILTDGEPDGGKEHFIPIVKQIVKSGKVKIQIMACTHEEEEMAWLNDLDCEILGVDVTDDYYAERKEVLETGLRPRFSRGDWCMKAMLAPVSKKFDKWDESLGKKKVKVDTDRQGCCGTQCACTQS